MGAQEYFSVERTCSSGLDVGYGVVGVFEVRELDKIGLVNNVSVSMRDFVNTMA